MRDYAAWSNSVPSHSSAARIFSKSDISEKNEGFPNRRGGVELNWENPLGLIKNAANPNVIHDAHESGEILGIAFSRRWRRVAGTGEYLR
jgi:hypothetical protein